VGGLLTGTKFGEVPLQIVVASLGTAGFGFTVTVRVNDGPVQIPEVGVTVYVAVCTVLVGLVSVPFMLAAPMPAAPPVIPPVRIGTGQLNIVPEGTMPLMPSVGITVKGTPLHVTTVMLLMYGTGFTVMVPFADACKQVPVVVNV
jgi:hypothetical protein